MVAIRQDRPSAMIKVVQTVQSMSEFCFARRENPHAIGRTKRNCLSTEKINDSIPPSSAWKMIAGSPME